MTPADRAPIDVVHIDRLDDPRIDAYRDVRDRDLRGRDALFMAESELVLRRLLRTPDRLQSILLSPDRLARLAPELEDAGVDCPVFVAGLDVISSLAGFHVHRGVLAAGYRRPDAALELDAVFGAAAGAASLRLILVEGLTNVDNMGAIFRNAAAFGLDGVVLDGACCDPLYRKSIRVSMGHVFSVPYAVVAGDWLTALRHLRERWGLAVIAAEADPAAKPLWTLPRPDRLAVVFGGEGDGLRPETLTACDAIYAVPMAPGVPSLNVAVASAVFLYELGRGG